MKKQTTFSINCPSEETKENLRKLLKQLTAQEDSTSFDLIEKAVLMYGDFLKKNSKK